MAKLTLLEIVSTVGRALGSDEIDSIDETTESADITNLLRGAYNEVLNRRSWEFAKNRLRVLDSREVGDTQINRLKIPTDIMRLSELKVKYRNPTDGRDEVFKELVYLSPADFLDHVQSGNENDTNIDIIYNPYGISMLIRNDIAPTHYTSFDEEYLWFDAYDSTRGTGNVATDAIIFGTILPSMDWTDGSAYLPVPEAVEYLIIEEATSVCSMRLRQMPDQIAIRNSARQFNKLRELESKVNKDELEIDYSRRRR